VTAEPYFAVTTPSDTMVIENVVRPDTRGKTVATLNYEVVPRGGYIAGASSYSAAKLNKRETPDVQQARNAVALARLSGADQYAAGELANAQRLLSQTESVVAAKGSKRDMVSHSRTTIQAAEQARSQSLIGRAEAAAAAERAEAAAREKAARDEAEREAAARQNAEVERRVAEEQRKRADEERQRAEAAAQQAAADKMRAEENARTADAARKEAEAARTDIERERLELRAALLKQFNDILQTRDTARGLIVNVGDVLFATGRFELQPMAREKLARFAGIIVGHNGLTIRAEGYTDSTGNDDVNMRLSQQRADSVGRFLISQGVSSDRITTQGFGPANPVASNDSAEGRQQNRRVELVVGGEVIGVPVRDRH
jgi:outer membrane protein OmpA-like peptidoglycan-associated protein